MKIDEMEIMNGLSIEDEVFLFDRYYNTYNNKVIKSFDTKEKANGTIKTANFDMRGSISVVNGSLSKRDDARHIGFTTLNSLMMFSYKIRLREKREEVDIARSNLGKLQKELRELNVEYDEYFENNKDV